MLRPPEARRRSVARFAAAANRPRGSPGTVIHRGRRTFPRPGPEAARPLRREARTAWLCRGRRRPLDREPECDSRRGHGTLEFQRGGPGHPGLPVVEALESGESAQVYDPCISDARIVVEFPPAECRQPRDRSESGVRHSRVVELEGLELRKAFGGPMGTLRLPPGARWEQGPMGTLRLPPEIWGRR